MKKYKLTETLRYLDKGTFHPQELKPTTENGFYTVTNVMGEFMRIYLPGVIDSESIEEVKEGKIEHLDTLQFSIQSEPWERTLKNKVDELVLSQNLLIDEVNKLKEKGE